MILLLSMLRWMLDMSEIRLTTGFLRSWLIAGALETITRYHIINYQNNVTNSTIIRKTWVHPKWTYTIHRVLYTLNTIHCIHHQLVIRPDFRPSLSERTVSHSLMKHTTIFLPFGGDEWTSKKEFRIHEIEALQLWIYCLLGVYTLHTLFTVQSALYSGHGRPYITHVSTVYTVQCRFKLLCCLSKLQ